MPQVTPNEDGTRTFAINSGELGLLGEVLGDGVREVEKVLGLVDAPQVRDVLAFLKSVAG